MKNHITRRRALALTSAAFAASCADNTALSQADSALRLPTSGGVWSNGISLPFPVQEIYPCAHNGSLHLAGGFVAEDGQIAGPTDSYHTLTPIGPRSNETERANPPSTWFSPSERQVNRSALPTPRHHPHLVSFANELLIVAGFESPSAQAAWTMQASGWHFVEVYPRSGPPHHIARSLSPELPVPCAEAVVGVLGDGALHLAGGRTPKGKANAAWTDHGDTDHHFVLTSLDGQWETAAPCLSKRNSAAGDVINGNLHVVGGRTVIERMNIATHEVYDHKEDRWRTAAPMPQAQGGLAAAAIGNKLYVFGGEYFDNGGGVYKEAWVYDASTDAWSPLPDMPNPRHGLGAVALDGKIYTIGGALQPSGVETSALVEIFTP